MANRYWVAATASTWNATAGTKWSTTSGGAGGAAVPTAADDVFFDANSPSNCTTAGSGRPCRSLNFTGYTNTFTVASGIPVNIGDASAPAGNVALKLSSGMTLAMSGAINLVSTYSGAEQTITCAGKTLPNTIFVGPNSASSPIYGLADAFNGYGITHQSGTFKTNNYNVTCGDGGFNVTTTNTKTITLGTSTLDPGRTLAFDATHNASLSASSALLKITPPQTGANDPSYSLGGTGLHWGEIQLAFFTYSMTASRSVSFGGAGGYAHSLYIYHDGSNPNSYGWTLLLPASAFSAPIYLEGDLTSGAVAPQYGPLVWLQSPSSTYGLTVTGTLGGVYGNGVITILGGGGKPCMMQGVNMSYTTFNNETLWATWKGTSFGSTDNGNNVGRIRFDSKVPMFGKQSMLGCGI